MFVAKSSEQKNNKKKDFLTSYFYCIINNNLSSFLKFPINSSVALESFHLEASVRLPNYWITIGVIIPMAVACGKSSSSNANDNQDESTKLENQVEGFFVPSYDVVEGDFSHSDYDWDGASATVIAKQKNGTRIANRASKAGAIELDNGQIVALTAFAKNECPDTIANCSVILSEELGIGSKAMVTDLTNVAISNQGARGTCVGFSINEAVEILLRRKGSPVTQLSPQNTFFQSKRLTNSWEIDGLVPSASLEGIVSQGVALVEESAWPYNPELKACQSYNQSFPDHYCSETFAQGGGEDRQQPDPKVELGKKVRIKEAHQLFASVGRVKAALFQGHPVVLGVNANLDFDVAKRKSGVVSWVFKSAKCAQGVCGHALLAVGYQDHPEVEGGGYIIVKNSWGETWGNQGYAYLTYEWLKHSILDAQAIVSIEEN
jgi:hypothetical protein